MPSYKKLPDTITTEYLISVAKGKIPGHLLINKFGASSGIGTSFSAVAGGNVYRTPSTLTSLELVSDSANDAYPSGSGARTVTVFGVGPGWLPLEETVEMNGLTAVGLSSQFFRVYRLRVNSSGTYATDTAPTHNSTLTLRETGAGQMWATVVPEAGFGLGSSEIGVYSLPLGMTAYLVGMSISAEATKVVDVVGFVRENADTVVAPFSPMRSFVVKRNMEGTLMTTHVKPLNTVTGPADIGFMAKSTGGSEKVEVEFTLLCVET